MCRFPRKQKRSKAEDVSLAPCLQLPQKRAPRPLQALASKEPRPPPAFWFGSARLVAARANTSALRTSRKGTTDVPGASKAARLRARSKLGPASPFFYLFVRGVNIILIIFSFFILNSCVVASHTPSIDHVSLTAFSPGTAPVPPAPDILNTITTSITTLPPLSSNPHPSAPGRRNLPPPHKRRPVLARVQGQ